MGLATRRRVTLRGAKGASKSIVIPSKLKAGETATIAADRLMIVDPRGEIGEDDLLQFLEKFVEPNFWSWIKTKEVEKGS
jgi:hypothetical protein